MTVLETRPAATVEVRAFGLLPLEKKICRSPARRDGEADGAPGFDRVAERAAAVPRPGAGEKAFASGADGADAARL